jgi:hypothetical protein
MWLLPVLGCGGMNSSFSETVSFPPSDVRVCGISTTTPKCLPTITGTRYRTIDSHDDLRPVRQQEPFCAVHTSRGVYTLTTVQYQVPGITGTGPLLPHRIGTIFVMGTGTVYIVSGPAAVNSHVRLPAYGTW